MCADVAGEFLQLCCTEGGDEGAGDGVFGGVGSWSRLSLSSQAELMDGPVGVPENSYLPIFGCT